MPRVVVPSIFQGLSFIPSFFLVEIDEALCSNVGAMEDCKGQWYD